VESRVIGSGVVGRGAAVLLPDTEVVKWGMENPVMALL
jgi:hypothetical protein